MREIVGGCELVNADGQSVVWASRLLGDPLPERVAGIDLMHALLGLAEQRGYRVFFLGARAEVLERAIERMRERHPQLADRRRPRRLLLRRGGARGVRRDPREPRGHPVRGDDQPAQGVLPRRARRALGAPFVMGVGGSIDVVAGVTRRAPLLWQRLGLEWLFRLLQEPRRMFRRYAVPTPASPSSSVARS